MVAFSMGAEPSARPDMIHEPLLARVYYSMSLFVLGGTDLGVPVRGSSAALSLAWFSYFAAPAITASALVEAIVRVLTPELWRLYRLHGHVVIFGADQLSVLFARRLRERNPKTPVLVVEKRADHANLDTLRDTQKVHVLVGDFTNTDFLATLHLERASRVALLTEDDFTNLDTAAKVVSLYPELHGRVVAHVADLRMAGVLEGTEVSKHCEIFNTHQIAAEHMVETTIVTHFERTTHLDSVVLAGFGRFGQTVLRELQHKEAGRFDTVVIIDRLAARRAAEFDELVGFADDYRRELIEGDLADPRVWGKAAEHFVDRAPLFVLGSGDDPENLRTALWLARRFEKATIVVRCFQLSSFARDVERDGRITGFGVSELVTQNMPERWFS
jgi:Trk K+ transport system NAD-binding subunit